MKRPGTVGLLTWPGSYAVDALVASGLLPLGLAEMDGGPAPPPHYPLAPVREGDAVLVVSGWLAGLGDRPSAGVEALRGLRRRFTRVIGLDQSDPFQLDFDEDTLAAMDAVLKVNGVYEERDLYNWWVGAPRGDGCWREKRDRREVAYSSDSLAKIRLSVPCFVGVDSRLRRRTRPLYGQPPLGRLARAAGDWLLERLVEGVPRRGTPRDTVHFAGSFSHVQRLAALRRLRGSTLRWRGGLTHVPAKITGLHGFGLSVVAPSEHADLIRRLRSEGLLVAPRNRLRYTMEMMQCKAVLSVTGYGELCFRMAEAWATGRVLVCQDLSHVRTLYPLQAHHNVVYCRPDLADLLDILDDVECNYHRYREIAENGLADWRRWSAGAEDVIRQGFGPFLD